MVTYNMHVLIIPSWYPNSDKDVNGCFFREQVHILKENKVDVGVLVPQLCSLRYPIGFLKTIFTSNTWLDNGVNTYFTSNLDTRSVRLNAFFAEKNALALFEEYIKFHGTPDIIHVHSLLYAGVVAKKIKQEYGIPFVVTEHSSAFSRGLIKNSAIKILQTVVEEASSLLAVSERFTHLLDNIFNTPLAWKYIPNTIPSIFENKLFEANNSYNEEFIFCSISYLVKNKKVDVLIRAFHQQFSKQKKIKLHIGGAGPQFLELTQLVLALGLTDQVVFLGQLSREEVLDTMINSQVYVLASGYETFGVVLIESMALGKPVIATRCGGPESIVNDGVNGLLVDVDDIDQLSNSLGYIYQQYNTFDAKTIQHGCLAKFSGKSVFKQLNKVYQEAIKS